jgi:predicted DNA-binding protein
MTNVLTLRIPPDLLSKAEARAAQLGLDRAKYVRGLIEEDLARKEDSPKHTFASEDLLGSVSIGEGPYTNQRVREVMRARLNAWRAKNR